jgi:uncharacterized protein
MKRGTEDIQGLGSRTGARLLRVYKAAVSPALHAIAGAPGACRYQPTCSEYAAIAVSEYGLVRGGAMAVARVLRCHPLHRGGFDPVPARRDAGDAVPTGQVH